MISLLKKIQGPANALSLCAVLLFLSYSNAAEPISKTEKFEYSSFDDAEKADSFLKLEGKSTKAGLITTTFTGFVKNFNVTAGVSESEFKNVAATFQTQSLDTDNSARNTKMWDYCLEATKFPEIKIQLSSPVLRNKKDQTIPGTISIRGQNKPIKLVIAATEDESEYLISGETVISIKASEIPDPSIFIAKVKDEIKIIFKLKIKKGETSKASPDIK